MLLTIVFAIINGITCFFGRQMLRMAGWDIMPFAIVFLSWHGENLVLASLLLSISYAIGDTRSARFVWLSFPLILLLGILAKIIPNMLALILIYHAICLFFAIILKYAGGRYVLFMATNLAINVMTWRIYSLFT